MNDRIATFTLALVAAPSGAALPDEPAAAEVAALTAPDALEALDEEGLRRLDVALAGALVRLRAGRRAQGRPAPLVVEASVENLQVPWHDRADYILTVDQPWPPALEAFRELFAGALDGADVRLDFRDERERVVVRPLSSAAE